MLEQKSVIDKLNNRYTIVRVVLVSLGYIAFAATKHKDFHIFMLAAKALFNGKDLYTITYVDGYHFFYSVLFACVVYPFTLLPEYLANFLWLSFNLFLLIRLIKIVAGYFNIKEFTIKQQWVFLSLCTLTCFKFALENIDCHQATILILYLSLQGLESIWKGNKIVGALLIALAINFKVLPILLIPYLLYRREFIATLFIFIFYAVLLYVPIIFIGIAQNNFLLSTYWSIINPANQRHVLDTEEGGFSSLTTWLATLLVYQPPRYNELTLARNIANLTVTQLGYIINIVRLIFLTFTLYFLRTKPFVKKVSKTHRFWELSYILFITPLLFPHQQLYSFLFATPAICWILYHFIKYYDSLSKPKRNTITVALTLSFILCNLSFLLGEYDLYYGYYKTLTYGILILVPLLIISVPDKEEMQV